MVRLQLSWLVVHTLVSRCVTQTPMTGLVPLSYVLSYPNVVLCSEITYTISQTIKLRLPTLIPSSALHWYKPNLTLPACALPHYTINWDAFQEALKSMFGEPDPVTLATMKLNNLIMKDHHHM